MKIPIFIITKNRTTCLEESIESYYRCIGSDFEIVIHDNNSTFDGMLNYLEMLENNGIKIYRNYNTYTGTKKKIIDNELNSVANTIEDYLKYNNAEFYIVTDPDIALDCTNGDILEFYMHILNTTNYNLVGPSLRIDDIPDYYPLRHRVLKHEKKFWTLPRYNIEYNGMVYEYVRAKVDTTFAIYRSSTPFRRLTGSSIRTTFPYVAKHLDWYIDPNNMKPDQLFYMNINRNIFSHWCGNRLYNIIKRQFS